MGLRGAQKLSGHWGQEKFLLLLGDHLATSTLTMPGFYRDTIENTKRWAVLIKWEMGEVKLRGHLRLRVGRSECIDTRRLSQRAEQHSASVNRSIRRLIDRRKPVTSSATNPKHLLLIEINGEEIKRGRKQYGSPYNVRQEQDCRQRTEFQIWKNVMLN